MRLINVGAASRTMPMLRRHGKPGLITRILTGNLQPITALSESGDAIATHSVGNLPDGVTVTGWSLTAGGEVFQVSAGGVVTVLSSATVEYADGDQSYTVQATLSAGDPVTLDVDVTVNQVSWGLALDFAKSNVLDYPGLTFLGGTDSTQFQLYDGSSYSATDPSERVIVGGRREENLLNSDVGSLTLTRSGCTNGAVFDTAWREFTVSAETVSAYWRLPAIANDGVIVFRWKLKGTATQNESRVFCRNISDSSVVTPDFIYIESGPGSIDAPANTTPRIRDLSASEDTTIVAKYSGLISDLQAFFYVGDGLSTESIGNSLQAGYFEAYAREYIPEPIDRGLGNFPFGLDGVRWYNTDQYGEKISDSVLKGALLDSLDSTHNYQLSAGDWYSKDGTFFVEMEVDTVTTGNGDRVFSAYGVGGTSQIELLVWPLSGNRRVYVESGGTSQASLTAGAIPAGVRETIGFALSDDDFRLTANGATITDSDGVNPAITVFRLGLGATQGNGLTLRRILFTSEVLSDAQIAKVIADGLESVTSASKAGQVSDALVLPTSLAVSSATRAKTVWTSSVKALTTTEIAKVTNATLDTNGLYNAQILGARDAARLAIKSNDMVLLKDVSDVLNPAFSALTVAATNPWNVSTSGRRWIHETTANLPSFIGKSVDLRDRQFLSMIAEMCIGMLNSHGADAAVLKQRAKEWSLVVMEHIHQGVFNGWQASYVTGRASAVPNYPVFENALSDRVLFGMQMLNCMAQIQNDYPDVVQYWAENGQAFRTEWKEHVREMYELLDARITYHSVNSKQTADIDRGFWSAHVQSARHSGYVSSTPPLTCDENDLVTWAAGAEPGVDLPTPPATIGYDISHARRLPQVFPVLLETFEATDEICGIPSAHALPSSIGADFGRTITETINFGTDARPRFANWTDGSMGWYRVQYSNDCHPGYNAGDTTIQQSIPGGSYFEWMNESPELKAMVESFLQTLSSADAGDVSWVTANYPKAIDGASNIDLVMNASIAIAEIKAAQS